MTDEQANLRVKAMRLRDDLERKARILQWMWNHGGDWDQSAAELEQQHLDALSVERIITYRVTIGTGGPACGVDYLGDESSGRVWWQEWFTEREYADLNTATSEALASSWRVNLLMDEDDYRERR